MHKLRKELELAFWKAAIPLLTQSAVLRKVVKFGSEMLKDQKLSQKLGILLLTCCLGFGFGMLAFSVYALVS